MSTVESAGAAFCIRHARHRFGAADDAAGQHLPFELLADARGFDHPSARSGGFSHHRGELLGREWLGQIIVSPALDRFDRGFDGSVRGDDDHHQVGRVLLQSGKHFHAGQAGHSQIEQRHVERFPRSLFERLGAVCRERGREAGRLKRLLAGNPHRLVVINDQDFAAGRHQRATFATGSETVNAAPFPGVLLTVMSPPCPCTMP
jgi:hypothetical protein